MKFYNDGAVNFPYLSDGMWFLTQHKRWGLLKEDPDYLAVAKKVNQIDIYKQAAARDQDAGAEGRDAHLEADRRRGLGRQGPEEIRRRLQDQGRVTGVTMPSETAHECCNPAHEAACERQHRRRCMAPPPPRPRSAEAGARLPPPRAPAYAARSSVDGRRDARDVVPRVFPPLLGLALFVGIWALIVANGSTLPGAGEDLACGGAGLQRSLLSARARTIRASAGTS